MRRSKSATFLAARCPSSALRIPTPRRMRSKAKAMLAAMLLAGFCAAVVHASPAQHGRRAPATRTQQCREGCFDKFATKETLCQQSAECLTCWDECDKPPPPPPPPSPPKINKSIRETWSLHTVSMLQQDSLVLVDVAWAPLTTPTQCLVTWEVSGGGLMGNLLTESYNVQLSLWPDTRYRVQVTCKNKLTGIMSRSLPLTIDTTEAVTTPTQTHTQLTKQPQSVTTLLPVGVVKLPKDDSDVSDLGTNSISDTSASAEQEVVPDPVVFPSGRASSKLPFDDQSAESLNQHTSFVFNWHKQNEDISAIEPLPQPDLNLLTMATLAQLQKPLIFGVVAGVLLLAFILLLYVCITRQLRVSSDKLALITDEAHSAVVSLPPPTATPAAIGSTAAGCKYAATCSRMALKV